ncbi:MAG TPA: alpha/beta fold hydrolase [Actinomycetota bacterium]|nr:alpha/beta fold hydrolase [Actinomycetota bacterium]
MAKAVAILLGSFLLVLVTVWVFQRRLIYLPFARPVPPASGFLPSAQEVTLRTDDGLELGAWFLPAADGGSAAGVLVANGNAGDRSFRAPLARALSREGFAVLLFDYRGFGGNPGTPTEEGLALDVRAAHDYLVERAELRPERLLYFGESLGAAVVAELATEHPPAGLVLRSPFADLASVGRVHYPFLPVGLLLKDRFDVALHVASLDTPITVVYGSADSIVPPSQSRAVAEAAPDAQLVEVPGADHNDPVLLDSPLLLQAVVDTAGRAGLIPR